MEFLYTRQQMEGFKGYQSKVKIGNWSEDMELEAAKLKDYLMKKQRGLLKCSQVGRCRRCALPLLRPPVGRPACSSPLVLLSCLRAPPATAPTASSRPAPAHRAPHLALGPGGSQAHA